MKKWGKREAFLLVSSVIQGTCVIFVSSAININLERNLMKRKIFFCNIFSSTKWNCPSACINHFHIAIFARVNITKGLRCIVWLTDISYERLESNIQGRVFIEQKMAKKMTRGTQQSNSMLWSFKESGLVLWRD
jgi:hypothetical protein